jgi:DNA-binding NarL/FixJ family response regulator
VRLVIADDEVLLREGLERLLTEAGMKVVGKAGTVAELLGHVASTDPDVAIVDLRMPPTHTNEGLVAAREMRASYPHVGVLLLSHHLESTYATSLIEEHPGGAGYLLKERVLDVGVLVEALRRIAAGECVVDPAIVARLLRRPRANSPLPELTEREREVLQLMAEGRSNRGASERLHISPKTLEAHVRSIFMKLTLDESPDDHRRVLAVLSYLRASANREASP